VSPFFEFPILLGSHLGEALRVGATLKREVTATSVGPISWAAALLFKDGEKIPEVTKLSPVIHSPALGQEAALGYGIPSWKGVKQPFLPSTVGILARLILICKQNLVFWPNLRSMNLDGNCARCLFFCER
jgi:hypothetical protein